MGVWGMGEKTTRHIANGKFPILVVIVFLLTVMAAWSQTSRPSVAPRRLVFVASEAFNRPLKDPTGVWCDTEQREILVADTGNGRVVIFDENGRAKSEFVHSVTRNDDARSVSGEPRRLAVNSKGEIFIVDSLCNYVDVCDYRGRSARRIHLRAPSGAGPNPLPIVEENNKSEDLKPVAVTVDYRDNLYVATSTRIFIFNAQGEFQRIVGKSGNGPGEFIGITSLWVDTAGRIYVTDARSLAVHVLTSEGEVIAAFGEHETGFDNFSLPIAIATDRRGYIWVADTLRHVVSVFERDGKDVKFLDYIGAFGTQPGQFAYPSGLSAAWNGRLVVVDRLGGRVQCFEM